MTSGLWLTAILHSTTELPFRHLTYMNSGGHKTYIFITYFAWRACEYR